eukprot:CAMPEP_0114684014 /NCGR_PEP_ID=MMETSP0191-20121206/58557_1 /TAXON_ID=126664 /ORGANISM="Sorites sp." /LENGTH=157 /DNA_ID=CAMNT_0001966079 /DNA_START=55 /DNA_END=524 /DNA_ORIENTATION=+
MAELGETLAIASKGMETFGLRSERLREMMYRIEMERTDIEEPPPTEWCMDFLYTWRSLPLALLGAMPFVIGTHITLEHPQVAGAVYYVGLSGLGAILASVIPTFTEYRSTARSLATSGGLAGGYILGLLVSTIFVSPVQRPLLRTAATTACIVIPWA